jgi:hypothetical protein
MELPEVRQIDPPDGWDWQADLRDQERTIPWLARKTGKSQSAVYAYAYGRNTPPPEWLRDAARVLGKGIAA